MTGTFAWLGLATALALGGCSGDGSAPPAPTPPTPTPPDGSVPPPSAGHDLVYHDGLGVVVLVNAGLGGVTQLPSSELTRLYAWNGQSWNVIDSAGPPVRNLGGVAYDVGRDVLVMHGGSYSADLSYGDTWEWSMGAGWRKVDVAGPGVRYYTQMTYDASRARIVLYGGQSSLTSFPEDTWTWDGIRWESVATSGPSSRVHHAMQYDPAAGQVVLFGGYQPNVRDHGDTWGWNGTGWAQLLPESGDRTHARMAYDERAAALVLVGGTRAEDRILAKQPDGWHPLSATGGPSARYLPGVAYDKRRQRLVVFGGGDSGDPSSDALFDDTWEYDGASWSRAAGR